MECVLNDAEDGVHNHLNAILGPPVAEAYGATQCGAHRIDWHDWTPADDTHRTSHPSCTHLTRGVHRIDESMAAPPGALDPPPAWLDRGELWVNDELVSTCVADPLGPEPDHCETHHDFTAHGGDCIKVEAITILTSGYRQSDTATGPWSTC